MGIELGSMGIVSTTAENVVKQQYFDYSRKITINDFVKLVEGSLTEITGAMLQGVTQIADRTFYYNNTLESVVIPDSVKEIGKYAFASCTNLKSVTMGNGMKKINERAFGDCDNLNSVHIDDLSNWCELYIYSQYSTPLYYAKHLYLNGKEVQNLIIPADVKSVKQYVFCRCEGLTSISMLDGVTSIGARAFDSCTGLISATIAATVTTIENHAFYNCKSLKSLDIKEGLTKIGDSAFANTAISSIIIPASIKTFGMSIFSGCTNLTEVIFNGQPTIGTWMFNKAPVEKYDFRHATSVPTLSNVNYLGHASGCQIIVPDSLYDAWTTATNWSALTDVVWVKASEYVEA